MVGLLKLALLKQILLAQNPVADTSPQALLAQANCFSCFGVGPGEMQLMELALLAQISANGTGGGGIGNPAPGVVNPEGNVTANAGATYFNTANSTFWEKASGAGNTGWVQLI